MKNKILHNLIDRSNKGMTLVERVVCFALLSIFVVSATMIIMSVTNNYYYTKGETYARQVADIVMTKIEAEVSGAKGDSRSIPYITSVSADADSESEVISDESKLEIGNAMDLYDRTDTHIRLFANDGVLNIYYYDIDYDDKTANYNSVFWRLDDKVYNGYEIDSLSFSKATEESGDESLYPYNVIKVDMTLHHPQYGNYSFTEYIKMYNLPEDEDIMVD